MTALSLRNFWHPVATLREVGDRPVECRLLGERLVAFRHAAGVSVLHDRCAHRGAALSAGRLSGSRLVCPYHGWQYGPDGACEHIPSQAEGSAIPQRARVQACRVREAYDLVWVALDEPLLPFPTWPRNAWADTGYRVFLINQYDWRTSAGRAVENALDLSHFNFVHAGYTELADGPVIKPHAVERTATGLAYAYEDSRIRREYELHFPFVLHDTKRVMQVKNSGTWSEAAHGSAPGHETILTFIASPLTNTTARLYSFMARNHSFDVDDASFVEGFNTVAEQDRRVVESQLPLELPLDAGEELHLRYADAAAVLYRRLFRELQAGAGAEAA